ncbi:MAG: hypothetical protein ACOZNI_05370 [Myxococcota bacterium]
MFALALSLLACWDDHDVIVDPPPPTDGPALRAGAYEIQILDVTSLACEGVRPQDVVGQSLSADLFVSGDRVEIDFEGWILTGDMSGGSLFADGTSEWAEPVEEDDEVDYDDDEEADAPRGSDSGEAGAKCDADPGVPEEEERGDELYAAISATVISEHLGSGSLFVEAPGCSMDLEMAMLFVGPERDEDVVVVEPEPREEEEGGEEPPCDPDSDCG